MSEDQLAAIIARIVPALVEQVIERLGESADREREYYTPAQFVRLLEDRANRRVTEHTVCARWIKDGLLNAEKDPYSRRWFIPASEAERVLRNGGEPRRRAG